jgi:hypothetical protein
MPLRATNNAYSFYSSLILGVLSAQGCDSASGYAPAFMRLRDETVYEVATAAYRLHKG